MRYKEKFFYSLEEYWFSRILVRGWGGGDCGINIGDSKGDVSIVVIGWFSWF